MSGFSISEHHNTVKIYEKLDHWMGLPIYGIKRDGMNVRIKAVLREIKARKHAMEEMGAAYMAEGLVTLAGSRMYTSMADDYAIIDDALARFERVFKKIERPDQDAKF